MSFSFVGSISVAGPNEDEALKVFAKAYLPEQAKYELAKFLNENPQVVFSQDPQVGTKALQFVGKLLAGYNFVQANDDKARGFAAAQFFAPDPMTSLIIFAIQLSDTVITIKHMKNLAQIYKEATKLQNQTIAILTDLIKVRFLDQWAILDEYHTAYTKLSTLEEKFNTPLYPQDASSIAEYTQNVFQYEEAIREYIIICGYVKTFIDFEAFGLSPDLVAQNELYIQKITPELNKISQLKENYLKIFARTQSDLEFAKARHSTAAYKMTVRLFNLCIQTVNTFDSDLGLLEDCDKKFNLKSIYL